MVCVLRLFVAVAVGLFPVAMVSTSTTYVVAVSAHSATPVLSISNGVGRGHSPCNTTFNPAWVADSATPGIFVRTDDCVATNGQMAFAPCDLVTGVCQDLDPTVLFPVAQGIQDPRIVAYEGFFYNFAYGYGINGSQQQADNCTDPQCSVLLSRSATPLVSSSWQHINTLPWHRNGCCFLQPVGQPTFCIWGEGPDPFPGLGISMTTDITKGHFTQVNWTGLVPGGSAQWLLPLGPDQNEIKLEAGTHLMQLESGDLLHVYAAATPGWVPNGNYTAGFLILDGKDPTKILQRSTTHILIPTFPYETLCQGDPACPYQGERKNVVFVCSITPLPGQKDTFRLFFGGGDGNVGTAVLQVTTTSAAQSKSR